MNAVDTNVFVYSLDAYEPAKQQLATTLLARLVQQPGATILLWQVAVELLSCLRRWQGSGRLSATEVERHAQDVLRLFPLAKPGRPVIERSLDLPARFSLSRWDSLLVAAALDAKGDTLYTEDLQAGALYESLKIFNPFV